MEQLQFAGAADFLRSDAALQTARLIVDVQMLEMTGLELHRHFIASGRPVPTVLISAHPDETTRAGVDNGRQVLPREAIQTRRSSRLHPCDPRDPTDWV